MTRFDPRAIFIALLLSLALGVVGGFMLVSLFGVKVSEGMTQEQVREAVRVVTETTEFLLVSLLYGCVTSVFAGFVAARLARGYPYFNALGVGVLDIVLGLLLPDKAPWWYLAVACVLSIPLAVLGAHLSVQQQRNQ